MALEARGPGIRLRPLAIGDVLDETFRVYRRQFVAFLTAMGVVVVPTTLITLGLTLAAGLLTDSEPSLTGGLVAVLLIVPIVVVASLARLVAGAAVVQIASDTILGRPVNVGAAYRHAYSRLGPLLWSSFLVGMAVGLLVMTCVGIPVAVYFGLGWALVFPAIVLEGLGGTDGMRRSWHLVREHRWRILACTLLIGLIVFLLISIPAGLFGFVAGIWIALSSAGWAAQLTLQVGNSVFQALGETLFGAIGYITITLIYYDLRVRKEAFDLQQRAELGNAAPSPYDPAPLPYGDPAGPPATNVPRIPPPPNPPDR